MGIVAFQLDPSLVVSDAVCSGGWVVADLLRNQRRFPGIIIPRA